MRTLPSEFESEGNVPRTNLRKGLGTTYVATSQTDADLDGFNTEFSLLGTDFGALLQFIRL